MQELDPRTGRTVLDRYNRGKYHRDTVLDGEIVLDVYEDGRQRLKFLVFDTLVVDRKSLLQRNLSTRLGVPPSLNRRLTLVCKGVDSYAVRGYAKEGTRKVCSSPIHVPLALEA
jgi:hypothetical protein